MLVVFLKVLGRGQRGIESVTLVPDLTREILKRTKLPKISLLNCIAIKGNENCLLKNEAFERQAKPEKYGNKAVKVNVVLITRFGLEFDDKRSF